MYNFYGLVFNKLPVLLSGSSVVIMVFVVEFVISDVVVVGLVSNGCRVVDTLMFLVGT